MIAAPVLRARRAWYAPLLTLVPVLVAVAILGAVISWIVYWESFGGLFE